MRALFQNSSRWDVGKLLFFSAITLGSGLIFILTPTLLPSALISVLLYFMLAPVVDRLERRGISRGISIMAIFAVMGVVVTVGVTRIIPKISQEVATIKTGDARLAAELYQKLKTQEAKVLGTHPLFRDARITEKATDWVKNSVEKVWTVAADIASHLLIAIFLVPFLTFVLLSDGRKIQRGLLKLVPNRYFETAYSLMFRIVDEMGGFVAARVVEAILVSLLVAVGCAAADIPYSILLGLFAGATNAIPYLGPLIGAVPAILIAVLDPTIPNQLLWVVVIFGVANLIDMVVIFPLVVAKIVDLHPVVVVTAVILGSQLFGILGMIVAVPLTSIAKIFIQELYARIYGDSEQFQ